MKTKIDITWEELGYLTTREMWQFLAKLNLPYCRVVDDERENLSTGEKMKVPRFIPRTDYDNMKSDIIMGLKDSNREVRRRIEKEMKGLIKKRREQIVKKK